MKTILVLLAFYAKAAGAQPAFDVASVKPNHELRKGGEGAGENPEHSPTSVTMTNATLLSCVEWAWGVREYQVAGAPGWFASEGFDIAAKTSHEVSEETLRLMMRTLLAERFGLVVRTEKKEIPVYAMTVAKGGHKLHGTVGSGAATLRPVDGEMVFENMTLSEFADRLARRPLKVDRPVLDETRLSGAWDFRLRFANSIDELKGAMESMDRGDPNAPLLSSLIQSQLGLRLEARKGPVDVLVVEHANRAPTGN